MTNLGILNLIRLADARSKEEQGDAESPQKGENGLIEKKNYIKNTLAPKLQAYFDTSTHTSTDKTWFFETAKRAIINAESSKVRGFIFYSLAEIQKAFAEEIQMTMLHAKQKGRKISKIACLYDILGLYLPHEKTIKEVQNNTEQKVIKTLVQDSQDPDTENTEDPDAWMDDEENFTSVRKKGSKKISDIIGDELDIE